MGKEGSLCSTSSTDGQPAEPGCDRTVTAKEMYPDVNESALMRKIDIRVVPALCLLFVVAFLDRVNMANAGVYGMDKELGLVGHQFNAALAIFFAAYILFEIPGNSLFKRFRPRVWLPVSMFIFGCAAIAQGFVKNYSGLLITRFFLGLAGAGASSISFYVIAMWYKREEAQKCFTFFIGSASIAGAFGGLLAYAISKLEGKAGLSAWRWVFVVEGILAVGCAIFLSFFIAESLEESKWLSNEEKAFVKARLAVDASDSRLNTRTTRKDVLGVFKIILGSLVYFGVISGYAFFAPAFLRYFGFNPVKTQLYSIPPWIATFALSVIAATASDYYKKRYIFILPSMLVSVVGIVALLIIHGRVHPRYGAFLVVAMGQYAFSPIIACLVSANLDGNLRRGVGTTFLIGFGNWGAIIAAFSYLAGGALGYVGGYPLALGFIGFSIICCTVYFFAHTSEKCKRAHDQTEHVHKSQEGKV